jgi:gluconolactonase
MHPMTIRSRALLLPILAVCLAWVYPVRGQEKQEKYPTLALGKIKRIDPRLDDIVPKGAAIEKILAGHVWTEGVCWVPAGKFLLFSDIPRNAVYKWQKGKGDSLFLKPSGYTGKEPRGSEDGSDEPGSNAIKLDPPDHIILCEHGDRQLSRVALKDLKNKEVLASKYKGKRLNSPNDCIFHSSGDLYFTDPPYGLPKRFDDPGRELDFCGVYRISSVGKDNKLTLLTKEMSAPNGIAFSLDEKTLYVANSDPKKAIWMAFPVKKDGTLGKGKVFYDVTEEAKNKDMPGLPDGMCIDAKGNIFATGPGGVYVFAPNGDLLGLIYTGQRTANVAFGDDGQSLYMATHHLVTRIRLNTKGKGF